MLNVIVASVLVFCVPTLAQDSVDQIPSGSSGVRPKNFEVSVKAETLQYPTQVSDDPRLNQNNMLEGHFRGQWKAGSIQSGLDVDAGKSTNLNYDYFSFQEIYSEYQSTSGVFSAGLGRKQEYWNQADRDWNLGLWEPLFQHDGLRVQGQGLTGLFLGMETQDFQFLAFLSPIFIPTMTPDIAEKNGAIVSESRWFRSLPSSQSIVGKETQLAYDLQIPAVAELIRNPGAGARLRLGAVDQGPWASISYARKAVNALAFRYDASVLTQTSFMANPSRAEIELNPVSHRHEIVAADLGYRTGATKFGLSFTQDRPEIKPVDNRINEKGFQTDYIQQQIKPVTIFTASASSVAQISKWPRRIEWRLDGLKAVSENSVDMDVRGKEQSQLIPDRLQFTNALAVTLGIPVTGKLQSSFRYLREFDQLGSLVSLNMDYRATPQWLVSFGLDSLGVDDPESQGNDTRFLNRYRQNDRAFGGLTYVY